MDEERFWSKVSLHPTPTGCLEWLGARDRAGYGVGWWQGRVRKAHAVAWELEHGPIARGLVLMHACDIRHCVNVVHLRLGTQAQNMADMVQKGRSGLKGARLTAAEREQVVQMLRAGERVAVIAERFGIQPQSVFRMKRALRKAAEFLAIIK